MPFDHYGRTSAASFGSAAVFVVILVGLRDSLAESRKHWATKLLRQIPYTGPIRTALLIALIQTPHRFRTKRQLWTYSGLAIDTRDSAQYRYVSGQLQRGKKLQHLRGLNENHNHDMKAIFKSVDTMASTREGAFRDFLPGLADEMDEACDGSPHAGAENCGHHSDDLEERSYAAPWGRLHDSETVFERAAGYHALSTN